jgi:hypothetical protein
VKEAKTKIISSTVKRHVTALVLFHQRTFFLK